MLGKLKDQTQREIFRPHLCDFIDMSHELVLLAEKIEWEKLEIELSGYYSHTGTPSMPVRMMSAFLLLKHIYNLGDETLAKAWVRDPYMQYFCGESHFQHHFPCDPSDLVHFRKRLGEEGVSKIFAMSVQLHGRQAQNKMVLSDTTVQENNIAFPTDARLAKKVIDKCNQIAHKEGIKQRQNYKRTSKQLVRDTHNAHHPKRRKKANKASRKLKTIAGRQIRELQRKLTGEALFEYEQDLVLMQQVIKQQRQDKDKIYSLHKPFTACIAKGKAHKPYEFGNKIGLIINPRSLVVTAIQAFQGNPHDSQTIEPLLQQSRSLHDFLPQELLYDRGGKGRNEILGVTISTPSKPSARDSASKRRTKRKKFRRRAAIEPVIGHLKQDHRMQNNYYNGQDSPQINAMLAASGWNLKKWMEITRKRILEDFLCPILKIFSATIKLSIRIIYADYSELSFSLLIQNVKGS
ncbi:MAG: IS5 family transposase [Bacteroidales bacterium]|nr:IS5 family transposase [Bacteroidales bacterium]